MSGSRYVDRFSPVRKQGRAHVVIGVLLLVATLFFSILSVPTFSNKKDGNSGVVSETFAITLWCKSDVGSGFSRDRWGGMSQSVPAPNASNRTLTLDQAYNPTPKFVTYFGEGAGKEGSQIAPAPDRPPEVDKIAPVFEKSGQEDEDATNDQSKDQNEKADKDAAGRITPRGDNGRCSTTPFFNGLATFSLSLNNTLVAMGNMIVSSVFNPSFFCKKDGDKFCVNLKKILAGNGGANQGLIGSLTNGVFLPLAVLASLGLAIYVIWVGLAKRQYRQALASVAKAVVAYTLGFGLLLNPGVIASFPQTAVNTISGCVVGALSGKNCFDGSSTATKIELNDKGQITNTTSDKVCAGSGGSAVDSISVTTGNLQCLMWKAFILEPWTSAQFGASFDAMDVSSEDVSTAISKAGLNSQDFCVNLTVDGKPADHYNKNIRFRDGTKVCNLAAYQMAFTTQAENSTADQNDNVSPDVRYFKLAWVMANSGEGAWTSWSSNGFGHMMSVPLSAISSLVGMAAVVFLGTATLAYYVFVSIMIVFAPIMLLFALIPGIGTRVFLGWGESMLGAFLKYFVTSLLTLVALVFYGSVLGAVSNAFLAFVFVIILTVALLMYRHELTRLLGQVSLGGTRITAGDSAIRRAFNSAGSTAKTTAIGAIGGAMGGMSEANKEHVKDLKSKNKDKKFLSRVAGNAGGRLNPIPGAKGVFKGANVGAKQRLRRTSGVIGQSIRTSEQIRKDNTIAQKEAQDLYMKRKEQSYENLSANQAKLYEATEANRFFGERVQEKHAQVEAQKGAVNTAIDAHQHASREADAEAKAQDVSMETRQDFSEWSALIAQLQNLQIRASVVPPNSELGQQYAQQATEMQGRVHAIEEKNGDAEAWTNMRNTYEDSVQAHFQEKGVQYHEDFDARTNMNGVVTSYSNSLSEMKDAMDKYDASAGHMRYYQANVEANQKIYDLSTQAYDDSLNQNISDSDKAKLLKQYNFNMDNVNRQREHAQSTAVDTSFKEGDYMMNMPEHYKVEERIKDLNERFMPPGEDDLTIPPKPNFKPPVPIDPDSIPEKPDFDPPSPNDRFKPTSGGNVQDFSDDELSRAAELVITTQFGSTSMLQRKMRVGPEKAERLMGEMASRGIIGEPNKAGHYEVLTATDELEGTLESIHDKPSSPEGGDGIPSKPDFDPPSPNDRFKPSLGEDTSAPPKPDYPPREPMDWSNVPEKPDYAPANPNERFMPPSGGDTSSPPKPDYDPPAGFLSDVPEKPDFDPPSPNDRFKPSPGDNGVRPVADHTPQTPVDYDESWDGGFDSTSTRGETGEYSGHGDKSPDNGTATPFTEYASQDYTTQESGKGQPATRKEKREQEKKETPGFMKGFLNNLKK